MVFMPIFLLVGGLASARAERSIGDDVIDFIFSGGKAHKAEEPKQRRPLATIFVLDSGFASGASNLTYVKDTWDFSGGPKKADCQKKGRSPECGDDKIGSGTIAAGIIHNMAARVDVVPVKVTDAAGAVWTSVVKDAFEFVEEAKRPALAVFNPNGMVPTGSVRDAIQRVVGKGIPVIVAAGDKYGSVAEAWGDKYGSVAQAWDDLDVLVVAGTDEDMRASQMTNLGKRVDLFTLGTASDDLLKASRVSKDAALAFSSFFAAARVAAAFSMVGAWTLQRSSLVPPYRPSTMEYTKAYLGRFLLRDKVLPPVKLESAAMTKCVDDPSSCEVAGSRQADLEKLWEATPNLFLQVKPAEQFNLPLYEMKFHFTRLEGADAGSSSRLHHLSAECFQARRGSDKFVTQRISDDKKCTWDKLDLTVTLSALAPGSIVHCAIHEQGKQAEKGGQQQATKIFGDEAVAWENLLVSLDQPVPVFLKSNGKTLFGEFTLTES